MNVKQATNVLDLLEYFAERQRPASLAEISRHFGWPRSSTFNLVGALLNRGFLYEPRAKAGYYPAPVWAGLIGKIEQAQPIPAGMRAMLAQLVRETGETAVLAAASGAFAQFIETAEPSNPVRYAAPVGKRVPIHVTATGRALLSQMTPQERASVLSKIVYERYTGTTLMSAADVEQEIELSSTRGWFQGNSEYSQDLGGVALAFEVGERRFAILVAGPTFRVNTRLPQLAQQLQMRVDEFLAEVRGLDHPLHPAACG